MAAKKKAPRIAVFKIPKGAPKDYPKTHAADLRKKGKLR